MIRCANCGTNNIDGSEYCDECGIPLSVGPSATQSVPAPPVPPPSGIPPPAPPQPIAPAGPITIVRGHGLPQLEGDIQPIALARPSTIVGLKEWVKNHCASIIRPFRNASTESIFPFAASFADYEAAIPLKPDFRFAHEPIRRESASRFVGRRLELDALAERILFSDGGSFLVTGYRGVGKTTFVNQVIRKLEGALPWAESFLGETQILDVQLNVARPLLPGELMHHIIRRLYGRLLEKGIYSFLSSQLKEDLTLAYQRTSINMTRKLAESNDRTFGFNEVTLGADKLATVKASWLYKRSRSQDDTMQFLGYDDKAAEHDIIQISRQLAEGYVKGLGRIRSIRRAIRRESPKRTRLKVVFVFDELDKLEEFAPSGNGESKPFIDSILSALKNLFTTSGISFVFVAGKDLQERWLEDIGRGDSIYESVFSYDKYLPCMWADVSEICDGLVAWDAFPETNDSPSRTIITLLSRKECCATSGAISGPRRMFCDECGTYLLDSSYARATFDDFKKYLYYKGRGIPRRIIRGFNEYVQWHGKRPALGFARLDIRRIRFYAKLQEVLAENERLLFGSIIEEALGTQQDKRRLGVYYLVDWILRQGDIQFTLKDAISASKLLSAKIAPAAEIAPRIIADIIDILAKHDYLLEVQKGLDQVQIDDVDARSERRYKLTPRRLTEMGGLAEVFEEESYALGVEEKTASRIGRYRLLEKIGGGGMASAYRAWDEQNNRLVAVKILDDHLGLNSPAVERFKREARIMSELRHPNIVTFFDLIEGDGLVYIAMEYIDGIDLSVILSNIGKLELNFVAAIARPVIDALQYVHKQGFVRNDIKPANVMISTTGAVRLIDFGIAKPLRDDFMSLTASGAMIGTPIYMAPEQIRGLPADGRCDIYSLGAVLYEMVTGKPAFENTSIHELVVAKISGSVDPPSQHADLPPELYALILKCLEVDPANRFQTMAELGIALSEAMTDQGPADLAQLVMTALERVKDLEIKDSVSTAVGEGTVRRPREDISLTMSSSDLAKRENDASLGVNATGEVLPQPAGAYLHIIDSPNTIGGSFPLSRDRMTIGRGVSNDIVLNTPKASRFHAAVISENGQSYIEDFNSANGTLLNGGPISGRCLLHDKDQIQIGDYILEFRQGS